MALDHGLSPETLEIAPALLAKGGTITALHVYEAPSGSVSTYLDESVVQAGYNATEAGTGCIVIGSHKPGLRDYLLGSTAAKVVRHAACAVHVKR